MQRNLRDLYLDESTTLKDFYENSTKKILINFPVLDLHSSHLTIFNAVTRPHMPIWAAILACSSNIGVFEPVIDQAEWRYNEVLHTRSRRLREHFNPRPKKQSELISSTLLTRLPLAYISNNKVKRMISNDLKEVYLTFNFSEEESPEIAINLFENKKQKFEVSSLSMR